MQYFHQQEHQGAPQPSAESVSAQLNEMTYADLGSHQFGQMLDAASADAQQQLLQPHLTTQLQTPQFMKCPSPQLNMMTCTDPGSEDLDQLLEAIITGTSPTQQQQASQQLLLYPIVQLQTQQIMEVPVWNACAPPLLHPVVSANTPDQFLSALDAYLGSALQHSTGQQHAVLEAPSTASTSLTLQQLQWQPSSSAPLGAASPSSLSSGCTSSATQQGSPWAAISSTAEAASNAVAADGTIYNSAAAAAAAAVLPPGHSDSVRGVVSVLPQTTTTRGVGCKRVRRPTLHMLCKQQREFIKTGSETAPSGLPAPPDQVWAGSSVPVDALGSSRGLVLRSDSLKWNGSGVRNTQARALLAECYVVGDISDVQQQLQQQQQQQLGATQLGRKRSLDTFKSPFASCRQNSGGSNMEDRSFAAQQQQGQQRQGWQQRTGSGSMRVAVEDQPPSPTTAAAAAAKVALQTAASSNLAARSSGAVGRSTLTWHQPRPAAAEGVQCGSSQPGASVALRMSMQLMHYAELR